MKSLTKRSAALVLALLMCLALFATGCKSTKEDYSSVGAGDGFTSEVGGALDDETSSEGTVGTSSSTTITTNSKVTQTNPTNPTNPTDKGQAVVNNCYTSGDKIAEKPVTLNIMIRDHANGIAKYNDSEFAKYVKERFNITLKFKVVSIAAVSEQTSLVYAASNSMPDMFWGMANTRTLHTPQIKAKKVVNLTPYIEKYGPNIKKMFSEQPDTKYLTTFDDGNTYYLPMYRSQDNYSWKYFINKKWLSNLGLSMPSTTDQFYNVLKAFKEQDANKNGNASDEIPLVIAAGESGVGQIPLSLFAPFGLYSYTNAWTVNGNKVDYAFATEEYRNGLRFYRKLYEEGLLYNAFRGATYKQISQWTGNSLQTVGVFAANNYSEVLTDESFMNNYMVMNPVSTTGTGNWINTPYEDVWSDWFVMTSACKYPEIAVRLVDWLYTEEGTMTALYGPKGTYWNQDAQGNIVFDTSKVPAGKTASEYIFTLTPGYPIPHYISDALQAKITAATNKSASPAKNAYDQQLNTFYKPKSVETFPQLYFTNQEIANTAGDYKSEAIAMQWNFIGGTASLDNDWDAYLKKLDKLGLAAEKKIYQNAYNRYIVWQKNNK